MTRIMMTWLWFGATVGWCVMILLLGAIIHTKIKCWDQPAEVPYRPGMTICPGQTVTGVVIVPAEGPL